MKKYWWIILLVVLFLIPIGYYTYLQLNDDKKEDKQEEVIKKDNDVNNDLVTEVMNKIKKPDSYSCSGDYDFYLTKDKFLSTDLKIDNAIILTMNQIPELKCEEGEVSADKFISTLHSILGKDYQIDKKSYNTLYPLIYNKNTDSFSIGSCPNYSTCLSNQDIEKITDNLLEDNKLVITFKKLFREDVNLNKVSNGYYVKYYKDYEKKDQVAIDKKYYTESNGIYDIENVTDEVLENAATYKFTFEKQDGNYVYVSTELVK